MSDDLVGGSRVKRTFNLKVKREIKKLQRPELDISICRAS